MFAECADARENPPNDPPTRDSLHMALLRLRFRGGVLNLSFADRARATEVKDPAKESVQVKRRFRRGEPLEL